MYIYIIIYIYIFIYITMYVVRIYNFYADSIISNKSLRPLFWTTQPRNLNPVWFDTGKSGIRSAVRVAAPVKKLDSWGAWKLAGLWGWWKTNKHQEQFVYVLIVLTIINNYDYSYIIIVVIHSVIRYYSYCLEMFGHTTVDQFAWFGLRTERFSLWSCVRNVWAVCTVPNFSKLKRVNIGQCKGL